MTETDVLNSKRYSSLIVGLTSISILMIGTGFYIFWGLLFYMSDGFGHWFIDFEGCYYFLMWCAYWITDYLLLFLELKKNNGAVIPNISNTIHIESFLNKCLIDWFMIKSIKYVEIKRDIIIIAYLINLQRMSIICIIIDLWSETKLRLLIRTSFIFNNLTT